MWLVLSSSKDIAGLWVYHGLKEYGLSPLELVSPEMLIYSPRWTQRLNNRMVETEVRLIDGRVIKSEAVKGVINRLTGIGSDVINSIIKTDQEYVKHEMFAFLSSWLYSFPCPVLNRPTSQGLPGYFRHLSEWRWLAAKAGLPTLPYRQSSRNDPEEEYWIEQLNLTTLTTTIITLFVIAGQMVGEAAPPEIETGCLKLAKLAGSELL
jgi:hypothetical protein